VDDRHGGRFHGDDGQRGGRRPPSRDRASRTARPRARPRRRGAVAWCSW
jgi:hypothetical protein